MKKRWLLVSGIIFAFLFPFLFASDIFIFFEEIKAISDKEKKKFIEISNAKNIISIYKF